LRTVATQEINETTEIPKMIPNQEKETENNKAADVNPNYYSKEWRNIHTKPGYKAYDQRVFNGFWLIMGLATLWSTSCYCYRRKFPRNKAMEYSRFDQFKRVRYVDEIIKHQLDNKSKTKVNKELTFDNIAEKETLDRSIARLQSIIEVETPRY